MFTRFNYENKNKQKAHYQTFTGKIVIPLTAVFANAKQVNKMTQNC